VLVLAHAGHWLIWVLYAVPVLIVLGSIVASVMRQRRESAAEPGDPASADRAAGD
jgi:cytochrome c-type biogenesis protein CcmH/NrfF